MGFALFKHEGDYLPLNHPTDARRSRYCPSLSGLLLFVAALISGAFTGFEFGYRWRGAAPKPDFAIHLDTVPRVWEPNTTFGETPSPETDRAWESLVPKYGGFFSHPDLAPDRSALSVFHQLHCLNALRKTIYAKDPHHAKRHSSHGAGHGDPETSHWHTVHCVDFLRQAIMCRPDLTIEVKDKQAGGVRGFGTEHQCRNWDQLLEWIKPWESRNVPDARRPKGPEWSEKGKKPEWSENPNWSEWSEAGPGGKKPGEWSEAGKKPEWSEVEWSEGKKPEWSEGKKPEWSEGTKPEWSEVEWSEGQKKPEWSEVEWSESEKSSEASQEPAWSEHHTEWSEEVKKERWDSEQGHKEWSEASKESGWSENNIEWSEEVKKERWD